MSPRDKHASDRNADGALICAGCYTANPDVRLTAGGIPLCRDADACGQRYRANPDGDYGPASER